MDFTFTLNPTIFNASRTGVALDIRDTWELDEQQRPGKVSSLL